MKLSNTVLKAEENSVNENSELIELKKFREFQDKGKTVYKDKKKSNFLLKWFKGQFNAKKQLKDAKNPTNLFPIVKWLGIGTVIVHAWRLPYSLQSMMSINYSVALVSSIVVSFVLEFFIIKAELSKIKLKLWKREFKRTKTNLDKGEKETFQSHRQIFLNFGSVLTAFSIALSVLAFYKPLLESWHKGDMIAFAGNVAFLSLMAIVVPFCILAFSRKLSTVKTDLKMRKSYSESFRKETLDKLLVMSQDPSFNYKAAEEKLGVSSQTLKDWMRRESKINRKEKGSL